MVSKYDFFFKSVKDFIVKLELVNEKREIAFDGDNFCVVEAFFNGEINKSIKSYLKYFGTNVEFKNNGIGNALFNFASISDCMNTLERGNVKDEIFKVNTIGGCGHRHDIGHLV